MAPQYGEREYWDRRYEREPVLFEWYHGYDSLKLLLNKYISRDSEVLQVGVGTSKLQAEMALDDYSCIVNIDYSTVVIDQMSDLHKDVPQLVYAVADCRHMPEFKSGSFDAVIDKGTLDAILCGQNSVVNAELMLAECSRVLKAGGVMVEITYGTPESRGIYLDYPDYQWNIQYFILDKPTEHSSTSWLHGPFPISKQEHQNVSPQEHHYIYVCRKRAAKSAAAQEYYNSEYIRAEQFT